MQNLNTLEACIYCPGQHCRDKRRARRLRDTRANRQREMALWTRITREMEKAARRAQ